MISASSVISVTLPLFLERGQVWTNHEADIRRVLLVYPSDGSVLVIYATRYVLTTSTELQFLEWIEQTDAWRTA